MQKKSLTFTVMTFGLPPPERGEAKFGMKRKLEGYHLRKARINIWVKVKTFVPRGASIQ